MRFLGKPGLALNDFEISDHNRSPIDVNYTEITNGDRTVSGKYRAYVVARKYIVSTSWEMLPSRAFYTVDQFWGGTELRDFYKAHRSFKTSVYADRTADPDAYLADVEFTGRFTDFNYSIIKRVVEGEYYDFWNLNLTIEEI